MSRPSEPLLKILRDLVGKRGLNNAAVAAAAGLDRGRLRKVLAGTEAMTVDELLAIGQVLEVAPEELGVGPVGLDLPAEEPPPAAAGPYDPWANQPEQIFRMAFGLGCDFMFLAKTPLLDGSGIPGDVLARYGDKDLPIRLDAMYHQYNDPRYETDGVTLTLSFDKLYDCHFPWAAVHQIILFPVQPEPPEEKPKPSAPKLRLVT